MLHRVDDGIASDRIEDDALDFLILEDAFALQNFKDMPGNRFTLAIRVGR